MRARPLKLLALALALAAVLPLAGDAAIPVPPASKAPCCNTADAIPPPTPYGDEDFFNIPGGVPNIMVLLDTSGSMFGLPRDVTYPAFTTTNRGTCSGHWLNAFTPLNALGLPDTTRAPFDNGYNNDGATYETIDDPPWGLKRCELKQARPAGDAALDYCLFRPDSYYKAMGSANSSAGWDSSTARVYNANPCAAITSNNGAPFNDYGGAMVVANDAAQCRACLDTAGFYVMNPRYQNGVNTSGVATYANAGSQVVFAGWFLNAFPPKFVAARKVVKDLIRLDATPRPTTDIVRFGLTVFNGSSAGGYSTALRAGDGGALVVPLGPNCDQSFPISRPAFATARQALIDAVNATRTATDWTDTLRVNFGGNTPLAETLFNVGQYFSNAGSSALYTSLFTSSWVRASFAETATGTINASWTGTGKNQHSFCWACQQSSVVMVTDGAPNEDNNLPRNPTPSANHSTFSNDFRRWSNSTVDCATCGNDLSGSPANAMHKVAYFLAQTDLRPDLLNGSRPQNVSTYTISFGINAAADAASAAAVALLQKTATLGGGIFANTSSAEELADALNTAVSDVVSRSTSFSSANANSLQTSKTTSADAYLGRFRPTNAPMWEGHLFAAQIFDEFGEGCDERFGTAGQATFACGTDPAKNPNIDGDETAAGRAICRSSYVIDRDCDPIVEDASGNFKKAHFDAVTHALQSDPDDANLHWDAGKALSDPATAGYRSADPAATNARAIYTVIDVNGNGRFDGPPAAEQVEFIPANAAALAPLMNLPAVAQTTAALPASPKWCNTWLNQIGVCGASPLPSCGASVATVQAKCAEHIINFYRGYDVMDWDADHCAGPGNYYNGANGWGTCTSTAQCGAEATCQSVAGVNRCVNNNCPASGEERDRERDSRAPASREFWKLGDVFHSSPVLVKAPLDKIRCSFGRENQCVPTIYSFQGQSATTATPLASYGTRDAYDEWRRLNLNRHQYVLVGANDGMLHAFDAGVADTSQAADAEGKYPYTNGTGEELWAFVPPDLLPRLREGLENHLYTVDGNTMVRDVWVDLNGNGTKEATEFRTVAILSERGGGARVTALDVSNPTAPAFLWTFPEPCSEDSKLAGQSWSDFLPRPPPIGPVRLAVAPASGRDPRGRGYEERWIAMLNGGYDAGLVRGRAVWTVDVWTGTPLWRFTDADFKTMRGDLNASMFPVAASIGMVDVGAATQATGTPDTDGYFDTATWGDLGGNLFTARFHEPGTVDPVTGRVTNWHAARAFETGRRSDDRQAAAGRTGFFFMTSNVLDGPSRLLSLLGTSDREHLLKQVPTCGPDNLLGCCASGCTVASATSATSYGAGSCAMGGTFQCAGGLLTYTPAATTGCGSPTATHACGTFDSQVTVAFSCGAAGSTTPSITAHLACGADGICTTAVPFSRNAPVSTAALGATPPQYRFVSVWSYGRAATRRFATAVQARAFEQDRFTDVTFPGCLATTSGSCKLVETSSARTTDLGAGLTTTCRDGTTKCSASFDDAGWMYSYGQWCPMETCSPATWTDEKSSGGALIALGCAAWSSFRPTGATSTNDPCTASTGNPTSLGYRADAKTGVARKNCGIEDTTPGLSYYLAQQKNAFAPPQNASMRIVVNERGQVNYSTLKIETGSPAEKETLGTRQSLSDPLYWLEVPRVLHTCRHVDPTTCE